MAWKICEKCGKKFNAGKSDYVLCKACRVDENEAEVVVESPVESTETTAETPTITGAYRFLKTTYMKDRTFYQGDIIHDGDLDKKMIAWFLKEEIIEVLLEEGE